MIWNNIHNMGIQEVVGAVGGKAICGFIMWMTIPEHLREREQAVAGAGRWSEDKRVVVITGAAQGIGLATAKRFAADGYRVAIIELNGEKAESEAEALRQAGNGQRRLCGKRTIQRP